MPHRVPADPYLAVIRRFNRRNVRYVVIGMAGINYYARSPATSFSTMDYDCLLEPTLVNLECAVDIMRRLRFTVGTSDGVQAASAAIGQLVRERRTLIATTVEGFLMELLLRVSGYTFAELAGDAKTFLVDGVPVRVGQLSKLLHSKRLAGRPKDQQFLVRYAAQLAEDVKREV